MRLEIKVENSAYFAERVSPLGTATFTSSAGRQGRRNNPAPASSRGPVWICKSESLCFPRERRGNGRHGLGRMQDGAHIRFRRRKGRGNTVKGEVEGSDRTFDENGLFRLLGNANDELYQNVFGFSWRNLLRARKVSSGPS